MLCSICLNLRAAQYEILNALTCYMLAFLILDFSCPCCHFKQVFKVAALKFLSSTELFCVFFFPKPSVIYKCWKACASLNFFFPMFYMFGFVAPSFKCCDLLIVFKVSLTGQRSRNMCCWNYFFQQRIRCLLHWRAFKPAVSIKQTPHWISESHSGNMVLLKSTDILEIFWILHTRVLHAVSLNVDNSQRSYF